MESSTVIAFRALVMLACLIVVPLAAIFGSQFPEVVKSVLIDRVWPPATTAQAHDEKNRAEAPPFAAGQTPAWRADAASGGPMNSSGMANTATAGQPRAGGLGSQVEPAAAWGAPDSHVRFAGGDPATAAGGVQRADALAPAFGASGANGAPGAYPGSFNAAAPAHGVGAAAPPAQPSAAYPVAPAAQTQMITQPDRFSWMEHRLRDYGATYYLLETQGERYRFICRMALANNPGQTRNFEAHDADPLRAMGRVVEQVEAWRAGRLP